MHRDKCNEKHKIWVSVVRLPTNACKLQLIANFYNHADKKLLNNAISMGSLMNTCTT